MPLSLPASEYDEKSRVGRRNEIRSEEAVVEVVMRVITAVVDDGWSRVCVSVWVKVRWSPCHGKRGPSGGRRVVKAIFTQRSGKRSQSQAECGSKMKAGWRESAGDGEHQGADRRRTRARVCV